MKVTILYNFSEYSGGANQFLKSLKEYFISKKVYSSIEDADIVLVNSHLLGNGSKSIFLDIIKLKIKYPNKKIIHRIDGPVSRYQGNSNTILDKLIYLCNKKYADGTIFQSVWSRKKNYLLGYKKNSLETTIINAPNKNIFYTSKNKKSFSNRKVKIIISSWSSNINKGFETYDWLDSNLDFSRYDVFFVGNPLKKFKNIKVIKPLKREELANFLRKMDIYITASKSDPCSNSLIEALHCGLPSIALDDGGHPEIIGKGGLLFKKNSEIPKKLEKITSNYNTYIQNINMKKSDEIGDKYLEFMKKVYSKKDSKKIKFFDTANLLCAVIIWKFQLYFFMIISKIKNK